MRAVQLQAYDG